MSKTFCHFLWDGITIDNKGNVFSCCHIKPTKMGNIYYSKLKEMINTKEIIECRKKSLKSNLDCFISCNLLDKSKSSHITDNAIIDYQNLKYLYLNFGEKCNISCIMCKHPKRYPVNPDMLDPSVLKNNIDLSPFQDILIQGGEPLYIAECLDFMNHLAKIGKQYIILTNGLLINDTMAEKLVNEAKIVSISLNAATKETHEKINRGSNFGIVIENIRRLKTAKERVQSNLIINGRMTLTTCAIKEIPEFLEKFQQFGFDKINFGYDKATVPKYLDENMEFRNELKQGIKKILKNFNNTTMEKIDLLRLKQLNLIK